MLACAFMLIGGGAYFYAMSEIRHDRNQQETLEQEELHLAALGLREQLHHAVRDIEFLAHIPLLARTLETASSDNLAELAGDFAAYMEAHGNIDQIRWIDETGMERIRVNFDNGQGHVTDQKDLQDKSSRPYVAKTMELPKGGLYVSPFDLNIENKRIEIPHKPVIRFATPLFDSGKHRRGLLIVNFLGRKWLDDFANSAGSRAGRLMLANREGYWLRNMNMEDEWGFMLDRPAATLAHQHPDAWMKIETAPQGYAVLTDGLWTWESINPLEDILLGLQYTVKKFGPPTIATRQEYMWHAILLLPASEIAAIRARVWRELAPNITLLLIISVLISAWIARSQLLISRLNAGLKERAKAAETANRAKADFVANMSHEIRTPMNAVLGLSYLLEKLTLPDEARELVRKIRSAGHSLQGIINDILDFSKIEAGRIEIENVPFRLGDIMNNISTIMATNAGDKEIELIITPPPHGIDMLRGDAFRLEQILINLTGNAIKFTDHGQVELHIDEAESSGRQIRLRFAVRDTGIGIPEEKQQEIFSHFSQADASTTRRFGGTGLGLSICRRLVKMMDGEIGVVSTPGIGSEFWFTLTFERLESASLSAPEMAGINMLIADDNPIAQEALRATAAGFGWNVSVVDSGTEAIRHITARRTGNKPSEVVILDWKMPDMDGLAVMRAIRGADGKGHEPIIVMVTAYSRDSLLAQSESKLADAVLSKPVTPSALYNAVARALHVRLGDEVPVSAQAGQRLAGLRMLVVDDSDINLEVAQRIFACEGADVALAEDGSQAVEWLRAHSGEIDIVLMDIQMPVMDGYEATRLIRSMPDMAALPIVPLTAGVMKGQQEAAKAAGMTDFISKPFNVDTSIELILKLTGHHNQASSPARPIPASSPPAPSAGHDSHEDFTGIAVEHGLTIWKDAGVYRRYLRKFAEEYADSAKMMAQSNMPAAAAYAHKLKGAAANLALNDVAATADAVDRVLHAEENPADALGQLQAALEIALRSIERYAPATDFAEAGEIEAIDTGRVTALLLLALEAFDTDSPDTIEPILKELAGYLPAEHLEPLVVATENFDFAGGKSAARELARTLGIALEE